MGDQQHESPTTPMAARIDTGSQNHADDAAHHANLLATQSNTYSGIDPNSTSHQSQTSAMMSNHTNGSLKPRQVSGGLQARLKLFESQQQAAGPMPKAPLSLRNPSNLPTTFRNRTIAEGPQQSASRPGEATRLTAPIIPRSTQRSKVISEDEYSNNAQSKLVRGYKTSPEHNLEPKPYQAFEKQPMATVTVPQASQPTRRPLFGEVMQTTADGSLEPGWGIPDVRPRSNSKASPRADHSEVSERSESPSDWYREDPASPVAASRGPTSNPHQYILSDSASTSERSDSSKNTNLQSRLPVPSKRLNESLGSSITMQTSRVTSPNSVTRINGASEQRPTTPGNPLVTPTSRSIPRQVRSTGNTKKIGGVNAYIQEASSLKQSPPLRNSRDRNTVANATTASSRNCAIGSTSPIDKGSRMQDQGRAKLNPMDYGAGRLRVQQVVRERIMERKKRHEGDSPTSPISDDANTSSQAKSLQEDTPLIVMIQPAESDGHNIRAQTMPVNEYDRDFNDGPDSPTLGIPGAFPSVQADEDARSAISDMTEFDTEPQTEAASYISPVEQSALSQPSVSIGLESTPSDDSLMNRAYEQKYNAVAGGLDTRPHTLADQANTLPSLSDISHYRSFLDSRNQATDVDEDYTSAEEFAARLELPKLATGLLPSIGFSDNINTPNTAFEEYMDENSPGDRYHAEPTTLPPYTDQHHRFSHLSTWTDDAIDESEPLEADDRPQDLNRFAYSASELTASRDVDSHIGDGGPSPPPKRRSPSPKPAVPPKLSYYSPQPSPVFSDTSSSVDSESTLQAPIQFPNHYEASPLGEPPFVPNYAPPPPPLPTSDVPDRSSPLLAASIKDQGPNLASNTSTYEVSRASISSHGTVISGTPGSSLSRNVRADESSDTLVDPNAQDLLAGLPAEPTTDPKVGSKMYSILSDADRERFAQRLTAIKEFVDTEGLFLRDMHVFEEIYKGTADVCPTLTVVDIELLFRNVDQLVAFTTTFLHDIKASCSSIYIPRTSKRPESGNQSDEVESSYGSMKRALTNEHESKDRQTTVASVITENLEDMQLVYSTFLARQTEAQDRMKILEDDSAVKCWLDECDSVARDLTGAWNIDSLWVKPLQRITKLPLTVGTILKSTPVDHPEYEALQALIPKLHQVLVSVNQSTPRARSESNAQSSGLKLIERINMKRRKENDTNVPMDPMFHRIVKQYSDDYFSVQILLRDIELYSQKTSEFIHTFTRFLTSIELVVRTTGAATKPVETKWISCCVELGDLEKTYVKTHLEALKTRVLDPIDVVFGMYVKGDIAVKKRYSMVNLHKKWVLKDRTGSKIDKKLQAAEDEFQKLTNDLKRDLPKFGKLIKKLARLCLARYVEVMLEWYDAWQYKMSGVLEGVGAVMSNTADPTTFQEITNEFSQKFDDVRRLLPPLRGDPDYVQRRSFLSQSSQPNIRESGGSSEFRTSSLGTRPRNSSVSNDISTRSSNSYAQSALNGPSYTSSPVYTTITPEMPRYDTQDPRYAIQRSASIPASPEMSSSGLYTRPGTGRSQSSVGPQRHVGNTSNNIRIGSQPYDTIADDGFVSHLNESFGLFNSAMPMDDNLGGANSHGGSSSNRQSRTSSYHRDNNPQRSVKVLYMAASLFEFHFDGTKTEAGYPYLTYPAGDIFEIIAEKGELWLAKNIEDPNQRIGWIWSKHFARFASSPEDAIPPEEEEEEEEFLG